MLEGKKKESYAVAQTFFDKHFDPEGLYFTARILARIDEPEACLDMLDRVVEKGFYCSAIMLRDPWIDRSGTVAVRRDLNRANARSQEAEVEFRRLNGNRILGLA